jgi:hypothetical protein
LKTLTSLVSKTWGPMGDQILRHSRTARSKASSTLPGSWPCARQRGPKQDQYRHRRIHRTEISGKGLFELRNAKLGISVGYLESGHRSRRPLPETHLQDPRAGSHSKSELSADLGLLGAQQGACRVSTARAGYIFQHLSSADRRAGVLSKCSKSLFRDS